MERDASTRLAMPCAGAGLSESPRTWRTLEGNSQIKSSNKPNITMDHAIPAIQRGTPSSSMTEEVLFFPKGVVMAAPHLKTEGLGGMVAAYSEDPGPLWRRLNKGRRCQCACCHGPSRTGAPTR